MGLTIGFISHNAHQTYVKFRGFAEENRGLIEKFNSATGRILLKDGTEIIKISSWEQLMGWRLDQVILAVDGDPKKFILALAMDPDMWYWLNRALAFSSIPDEFIFQQYGDEEIRRECDG